MLADGTAQSVKAAILNQRGAVAQRLYTYLEPRGLLDPDDDRLKEWLEERADDADQGYLDAFARQCQEAEWAEWAVDQLLTLADPLIRYQPIQRAGDRSLPDLWQAYDNIKQTIVYVCCPNTPPADAQWSRARPMAAAGAPRPSRPGYVGASPANEHPIQARCLCRICTEPSAELRPLGRGARDWKFCPDCARGYVIAHAVGICPYCQGNLLPPELATHHPAPAVPRRPEVKTPIEAETKTLSTGAPRGLIVSLRGHGGEVVGRFVLPRWLTLVTYSSEGFSLDSYTMAEIGDPWVEQSPVATFPPGTEVWNRQVAAPLPSELVAVRLFAHSRREQYIAGSGAVGVGPLSEISLQIAKDLRSRKGEDALKRGVELHLEYCQGMDTSEWRERELKRADAATQRMDEAKITRRWYERKSTFDNRRLEAGMEPVPGELLSQNPVLKQDRYEKAAALARRSRGGGHDFLIVFLRSSDYSKAKLLASRSVIQWHERNANKIAELAPLFAASKSIRSLLSTSSGCLETVEVALSMYRDLEAAGDSAPKLTRSSQECTVAAKALAVTLREAEAAYDSYCDDRARGRRSAHPVTAALTQCAKLTEHTVGLLETVSGFTDSAALGGPANWIHTLVTALAEALRIAEAPTDADPQDWAVPKGIRPWRPKGLPA